MSITSSIYLGMLVVGVILLILYHKSRKLLRCIFFTAFTGLAALGIVWLAGRFIPMPVAVTPLSLLISGVLGVPGVVSMLILQLI